MTLSVKRSFFKQSSNVDGCNFLWNIFFAIATSSLFMVERILSKEMYILTWAGKILGSNISGLSRKTSLKTRALIGQRNDINKIINGCFRIVKSEPRI